MKNIFERLLALVEKFTGGSQTAFAKSIGAKQSTFHGYLNLEGQSKIRLELLTDILAKYPEINRYWLFFGEGSMLSDARTETQSGLAARNSNGKLIGDLLAEAFRLFDLTDAEIAEQAGLAPAELEAILRSRVKPDFDQLEALYLKMGVNPVLFFEGKGAAAVLPKDYLLRLYHAIGIPDGVSPTYQTLAELFDIDFDEAENFLHEWADFRKSGDSLVIPPKWLEKVSEKYLWNSGWLENMHPPLLVKKTHPAVRKLQQLEEETRNLKEEPLRLTGKETPAPDLPAHGSIVAVPDTAYPTDGTAYGSERQYEIRETPSAYNKTQLQEEPAKYRK